MFWKLQDRTLQMREDNTEVESEREKARRPRPLGQVSPDSSQTRDLVLTSWEALGRSLTLSELFHH